MALVICATSAVADSRLERAGDIAQIVIPATAGVSTVLAGDAEGAGQFCKSFFGALGIAYALKYVVDKDRPEGHGEHSFPSGHATAAFQGAAFIEKRYGWRYGAPCYAAAVFVGWSRIEAEADKHDVIDVLAGAAIGAATSWCFTTRYRIATIAVTVDAERRGVCIGARW